MQGLLPKVPTMCFVLLSKKVTSGDLLALLLTTGKT